MASRIALLLALLALAGAAFGAPPPAFSARYTVLRNDAVAGEAELELRQVAGDVWELRTHTRGTHGLAALAGADLLERSRFRWRGDLPELVEYHYIQKLAFKGRRRQLVAEPAQGRIAVSDDGDARTLPFEPGVLDRHTVLLAIAAQLEGGAREFRFRVAGHKRVDSQRYRVAASESVRVGETDVAVARIERVREKPGRVTESWLPLDGRGYPIRVRQREPEGDTVELRLIEAE